MTKQPSVLYPVVWTAVNVLLGGWAIRSIMDDPTDWQAGLLLGVVLGVTIMEWADFSWQRLIADYDAIIDQYDRLVSGLCEGIEAGKTETGE